MLPEIKVYKIDYAFIINNYLDKRLWKKIWNLFVYKDNVFTLNLYEIDTENNKIRFKVKFNKLQWNWECVTYDIDNTPLNVLLQQINGAIFRLMECYEETEIQKLPIYQQIDDAVYDERNRLREIANNFLDSEGVTNGDIRDAYIERFVDNNETMYCKRNEVLRTCKYTICTDMYIVFCKATNDDTRLRSVEFNNDDKIRLAVIKTEVDAFLEALDTEDYENEMIDVLESVF